VRWRKSKCSLKLLPLLPSASVRGEWSALSSSYFILGDKALGIHWIADIDTLVAKRMISFPTVNLIAVIQTVASRLGSQLQFRLDIPHNVEP
jgi:hypothetical protein